MLCGSFFRFQPNYPPESETFEGCTNINNNFLDGLQYWLELTLLECNEECARHHFWCTVGVSALESVPNHYF
jgi:hypothetical protein